MSRESPYRLALFTDANAEEFTREMVRGLYDENEIQKQISGLDFQIFIIDGKYLGNPGDSVYLSNQIYKRIKADNFKGIIIHGGLLSLKVSEKVLKKFAEGYQDIPLIFMGCGPENAYQLLLDNRSAVQDMMEHLLEVHHYKNFLYLGGPIEHKEAIVRLQTFKSCLEERNMVISKENIISGDFTIKSGEDAVKELIKKDMTLSEWDCMVCANDDMAYGALQCLKRHGYRVPEDLAVTGFDNSDYSMSVFPSITTLGNPLYEMTRRSLEILTEIIEQRTVEPIHWIRAPLLIRQSCGCVPLTYQNSDSREESKDKQVLFPEDLIEAEKLFVLLRESLAQNNLSQFIFQLNRFLESRKQDSHYPLHERIFLYFQRRLDDEIGQLLPMHKDLLFTQIHLQIQNIRIIQERSLFINYRDTTYKIKDIQEDFRNSGDQKSLQDLLLSHIQELKLTHLYIVLFNGEVVNGKEMVYLDMAFKSGELLNVDEIPPYTIDSLLPDELWPFEVKGISVFSNLSFNNRELGFAFFVTNKNYIFTIPNLTTHLSTYITHVMNTKKLHSKNVQLEESLNELRITQERLLEAERLASMGEMVAGISHEINGPVGVGITLSTHIQELLKELQMYCDKNKNTGDEIKGILQKIHQGMDLLYSNLDKAADLVRTYKMVAQDQASEQCRDFMIHEYLEKVMLSLRNEYKNRNMKYTITGCEKLMIQSYPGYISQVLTQLLLNALQHGFSKEMKGEIRIELSYEKGILNMRFKDNGVGIASELHSKIFDPFYTTSRLTGRSGLGLHLVYNIVNSRLKGSIKLEETDKGASFICSFPAKNSLKENGGH